MSEETIQTFTGRKLDWLKCCAFDRRIQPWDFEVAFVISQHVNARTLSAMLSDEAIADEAGGSPRNVRRARERLRSAGWIKWRRTRTANIYEMLFEKIGGILDAITAVRDERRDRRNARRQILAAALSDRTPVSTLDCSCRTPRSAQNRPGMSVPDRTEVSAKHLRRTP